MYTKHLLGLLLILFCTNSNILAQSNCHLNRYVNEIFTEQITSEPANFANVDALIYPPYISEASTYNTDLSFDLYEPMGDTLTKRPLIIMAFGGAFLVGSKDLQQQMIDFCSLMARKGYVVVSIDYRLGFNVLDGDTGIRAVYRGLQDFKAAVRYFRANAATYNIDVNHVYGGGNSAGSINAIHAAYVDNADRTPSSIFAPTYYQNIFLLPDWPDLDCVNCSGNTLTESSKTNGVINLWGAMGDVTWIDAGEVPIISFHGLDDTTVNPNTAAPFGASALFPPMSGSIPIDAQCNSVGILSELHTYPGEGHELWDDPVIETEIHTLTSAFLFDLLRPDAPIVLGESTPCVGRVSEYCVSTPVAGSSYCWDVVGGTLLSNMDTCITVNWTTLGGTGLVEVSEVNCLDAKSEVTQLPILINSNPAPVANFSFVYSNNVVDFINNSTGAVSYLWNFGDGTTSTLTNPSHLFASNGTYNVSLTVTNSSGCMSELILAVTQSCQANMTLSQNPTASGIYQVEDWIQSNQPVDMNATVEFKAEDCIDLQAGFEVPLGTEFSGSIEACDN